MIFKSQKSAMKLNRPHRKSRFITTYIIAGGFLGLIIIGTLLLCLPVSSATGEAAKWSDALFVATSAVCVTGLVTVPTFSAWSTFGHVVILFLIQLGGLGLISFTMIFLQLMKRRIGMRQRQLIRDAYNLDGDKGLDVMMKRILKGTFIVEGIGAFFYCLVLVPEFGPRGIWMSIFNSISAFCNAGMDIIGPDSLIPYNANSIVLWNSIFLIVMGGLGFPIWFIVVDKFKEFKANKWKHAKRIFRFGLYEKTVFLMTFILIFGGAILIFIMEFNNEATIGNMPLYQKMLNALFQSVTTRTAGFAAIPQDGLGRASTIIVCILMFIGGSPSGTAGGTKTTTWAVIMASLFSTLSARDNTEFMKRTVNDNVVRRAISIIMVSFSVMMISLVLFCSFQPGSFEDCLYEVMSAIGTVGLTRNLTALLTIPAKLVLVFAMYLGRIGPISLALFFNTKSYVNLIDYPEENIPIG